MRGWSVLAVVGDAVVRTPNGAVADDDVQDGGAVARGIRRDVAAVVGGGDEFLQVEDGRGRRYATAEYAAVAAVTSMMIVDGCGAAEQRERSRRQRRQG